MKNNMIDLSRTVMFGGEGGGLFTEFKYILDKDQFHLDHISMGLYRITRIKTESFSDRKPVNQTRVS